MSSPRLQLTAAGVRLAFSSRARLTAMRMPAFTPVWTFFAPAMRLSCWIMSRSTAARLWTLLSRRSSETRPAHLFKHNGDNKGILRNPQSFPTGGVRYVPVSNIAVTTLRAVIMFLQTGHIAFAPRSSKLIEDDSSAATMRASTCLCGGSEGAVALVDAGER